MRKILPNLLDCIVSNFRSRAALQLEIIVLRHQLEVLQRTRPARVRRTRLDRMFWLVLYRLWPRCLDAVVIVKPETVIAWHRKGFRAFWAWKSRPRRRGRPPVPAEVRTLIRRMTRENPLWGAPRVHGELLRGTPNGGQADPTCQSRSIKWKGQATRPRRADPRQ